jgi:hypothetical protein
MKLEISNIIEMIIEISETSISDEIERQSFYSKFIEEFEGLGFDFKKIYEKSEDTVFDMAYEEIHPELGNDKDDENDFWPDEDF